ncbi:MAG TPA: hypothetical protein VJG65_03340, partial [Patescibacteria group bacterium]|nr:hypothetical protein [Patescibacteria group bacterium]
MKKTVEVKTLGVRWGLYPGCPPDNVLQHIVDVRGMMDDPANFLPLKPGTDSEISEWILSQPGVPQWLEREKERIGRWLTELDNRIDIATLRIYYHCRGGFQRSPAV